MDLIGIGGNVARWYKRVNRNASDPDGEVKTVEFFAGDHSLGIRTNLPVANPLGPFMLEWSNVPAGEYTLTAKALDNGGAVTFSAPVRIAVKAPEAPSEVLLPKAAVWKYLDDGSDQDAGWRECAFDDGAWKSGPAQLGFGDGDEATLLRPGMNDHRFVTYYFRRAFEVGDAAGISALTARLLRDDGAVVYLNGIAVLRSNMPEGPIAFNTLAVSAVGPEEENRFRLVSLNPRALVNGRNVVAVEVHQASLESSDLGFDLELTVQRSTPTNLPLEARIRDEHVERAETVLLALEPDVSATARYAIGRPSRAGAIIVDRDELRADCLHTRDGLFHLCLPADNGFAFRIEASTDLASWTAIGISTAADGAIHFVDPDAPEHENRFYRTRPETAIVDLDDISADPAGTIHYPDLQTCRLPPLIGRIG